jgi:hypothetical protein
MAITRANHSRRKKGTPVLPVEDPSEAQLKIFLDTYEETFNRYSARKAAGITRAQCDLLLARPEVRKRLEEIGAEAIDRVEDAAFSAAILKGDKDAQKLILQSRRSEVYGQRATVKVEVDFSKMSKDELKAWIAANDKKR